jgi:hypothetical protein
LRHRDAGFAEELLALIFVDLHLGTLEIAAAVDSGKYSITQRRRGRGVMQLLRRADLRQSVREMFVPCLCDLCASA